MLIQCSLSTTHDGVTLTTHSLPLGNRTDLVAFRSTNSREVGAIADVEVEARADGCRFVISASNVSWTVLLSHCSLVRSASKDSSGGRNPQGKAVGSEAGAWSCSWEGIQVEEWASAIVSFISSVGVGEMAGRVVHIEWDTGRVRLKKGRLNVRGWVESERMESMIEVGCIFDDDPFAVRWLVGDLIPGDKSVVTIYCRLADW
jgi:hypothetical protein